MRLLQTEITPLINDPLHIDTREQPFLWSPFHNKPSFHAHPEMELVFVEEGYGKRIIGNKIESFEAGDMVFIGSNVPHIWLSDPVFYDSATPMKSKVIVTYFNPTIFAQLFDSLKEFDSIRQMVHEASKGIRIYGETRNLIAKRLTSLASTSGFEKVDGLLQIMHLISVSREKKLILSQGLERTDDMDTDRLVMAINYVKANLDKPIYLHEVAELACMTESSFSRYFKQRMKKTFSAFLTELRLERAKEFLIQDGRSVKEIAHLCGYDSLAHFYKLFKSHTGVSPAQYKAQ